MPQRRQRLLVVLAMVGLGAVGLSIGVLVPFATAPSETSASATPRWHLVGSRIIGCCCAAPCPCRINKPPMYRHGCDGTTAVRIERGHFGQTRLDGVTFALTVRAFSKVPESNWNYLYVSDRAADEQIAALQAIVGAGGEASGAKWRHLGGRPLGVRKVRITYEISADRREHSVEIPGILQFRTRAMVLPGRKDPVVSTGIFDAFGDRFVHAECLAHTYNDPQIHRSWDLTGRQANQAEFRLSDADVITGHVGWGCWSAHASLGSNDRYQEELVRQNHR